MQVLSIICVIMFPLETCHLFYIFFSGPHISNYNLFYIFISGQLISDQVAEIVSKYDPKVYSIQYNNQLATRTAQAIFDDSYLGR